MPKIAETGHPSTFIAPIVSEEPFWTEPFELKDDLATFEAEFASPFDKLTETTVLSDGDCRQLLNELVGNGPEAPINRIFFQDRRDKFEEDYEKASDRGKLALVANAMLSEDYKDFIGAVKDDPVSPIVQPVKRREKNHKPTLVTRQARRSQPQKADWSKFPPPDGSNTRPVKATNVSPSFRVNDKVLDLAARLASYEISPKTGVKATATFLGITLFGGLAVAVQTKDTMPPKQTAIEQTLTTVARNPTEITAKTVSNVTELNNQLAAAPVPVKTAKDKKEAEAVTKVAATITATTSTPNQTPVEKTYHEALNKTITTIVANPAVATPEVQAQIAPALDANPAVKDEAVQLKNFLDIIAPSPANVTVASLLAIQQAADPNLAEKAHNLAAANKVIDTDPQAAASAIDAPTPDKPVATPTPAPTPTATNKVEASDNAEPETLGKDWTINTTVTGVSGITADQWNKVLADTNLAGLGQEYIAVEKADDINALYAVAHAVIESGWHGSNLSKNRNSLYGQEAYTSNPNAAKAFPTKQAAVEGFVKLITTEYLDPSGKYYSGGTSVNDIFKRYSTDGPGVDGEAGKVVDVINKNLLPEMRKDGFLPPAATSAEASTPATNPELQAILDQIDSSLPSDEAGQSKALTQALLSAPNVTIAPSTNDEVKKSIVVDTKDGKTFIKKVSADEVVTMNPYMLRVALALSKAGFQITVWSVTTGEHAKNSDHYNGTAMDISPESGSLSDFQAAYKFLYDNREALGLDQMVFGQALPSGTALISGGKDVNPSYYGSSTLNEHKGHIHFSTLLKDTVLPVSPSANPQSSN